MESGHERMHCKRPTASYQHSGSTLNPTEAPQITEANFSSQLKQLILQTYPIQKGVACYPLLTLVTNAKDFLLHK